MLSVLKAACCEYSDRPRHKVFYIISQENMFCLCLSPHAVSSDPDNENQVGHRSFYSGCSYPPLCLSWQICFISALSLSLSPHPKSVGCLLKGVELHIHYFLLFMAMMSLSSHCTVQSTSVVLAVIPEAIWFHN